MDNGAFHQCFFAAAPMEVTGCRDFSQAVCDQTRIRNEGGASQFQDGYWIELFLKFFYPGRRYAEWSRKLMRCIIWL